MPAIRGKIKSWDQSMGLGYITPDDGDKDVFAHFSAIQVCRDLALNLGLAVLTR